MGNTLYDTVKQTVSLVFLFFRISNDLPGSLLNSESGKGLLLQSKTIIELGIILSESSLIVSETEVYRFFLKLLKDWEYPYKERIKNNMTIKTGFNSLSEFYAIYSKKLDYS